MLQRLIAHRLITAPAIWGKLPVHADFVRSRMRHGEAEGWQPWLADVGRLDPTRDAVHPPVAFVLPPGLLAFAQERFVIGVITPSMDRVGRRHPLLVYQLASAGWMTRNFDQAAAHPQDWLFWLARGVARCAGLPGGGDLRVLELTVQNLWRPHAPRTSDLWRPPQTSAQDLAKRDRAMRLALDQAGTLLLAADPAAGLRGVRFFPRADWPSSLLKGIGQGLFWQQDSDGGYVNAAARLPMLWGAL
ncbi:MAG: type secretion-associated protein [Rhodoferax sp.]|nr:type secretion-associated protein [Rhodoferax sp.]